MYMYYNVCTACNIMLFDIQPPWVLLSVIKLENKHACIWSRCVCGNPAQIPFRDVSGVTWRARFAPHAGLRSKQTN